MKTNDIIKMAELLSKELNDYFQEKTLKYSEEDKATIIFGKLVGQIKKCQASQEEIKIVEVIYLLIRYSNIISTKAISINRKEKEVKIKLEDSTKYTIKISKEY